MEYSETLQIDNESGHTIPPGFLVNAKDLALLDVAIRRWEQFLSRIFVRASTRNLPGDFLGKISREDTERYLDVKIQLIPCMSAVEDNVLEMRIDEICKEIRKNTYIYISSTLPNFIENSRCLIELSHQNEPKSPGINKSEFAWIPPPGVEISLKYKDRLISERKRIKMSIDRQHNEVLLQIALLKKTINQNFSAQRVAG